MISEHAVLFCEYLTWHSSCLFSLNIFCIRLFKLQVKIYMFFSDCISSKLTMRLVKMQLIPEHDVFHWCNVSLLPRKLFTYMRISTFGLDYQM